MIYLSGVSVRIYAPISIFPQRGGGRDTRGLRRQKNSDPWELDRAPRHRGEKI